MFSTQDSRRAQIESPAQPAQSSIGMQPLASPLLKQRGHNVSSISRNYRYVKRCIDMVGSVPCLLILLLILPFIALLMLCEDGGPIFYTQERIGLDGYPFQTYKLRSMIKNADEYLAQQPELLKAWQQNGKLQNDPRVTRVGRFLRRTSLDELPQVINVLRGEMSLVGPRALQAAEIVAFGELGALRQTVKPGLTGLWQISGRSHTTYGQRLLLDCTYALECSIAIDIHILIRTIPVVIHGEGAY